jgi:hypothetical protein
MDKYPIIYLDIDENDMNSGMSSLSFVDRPATNIEWQTFNDDYYFKKNEIQRLITSPVMLAETPILRHSDIFGQYYVKFSKQAIFNMMKKYFKENKIHRVNEQHNSKRQVNNVYMVESFIVGDKVTSNLFNNIADGSWVATFFVEDELYWEDNIMNGDFNGFSLEGNFTEQYEADMINKLFSEIQEVSFSTLLDDEKISTIKKLLNI